MVGVFSIEWCNEDTLVRDNNAKDHSPAYSKYDSTALIFGIAFAECEGIHNRITSSVHAQRVITSGFVWRSAILVPGW
jgi:hypothetical protein